MTGYWSTIANEVMPDDPEVLLEAAVDPECVIVSSGPSKKWAIDPALDVDQQLKANFPRCAFVGAEAEAEKRLMLVNQVYAAELWNAANKTEAKKIWKSIHADLMASDEFGTSDRKLAVTMCENVFSVLTLSYAARSRPVFRKININIRVLYHAFLASMKRLRTYNLVCVCVWHVELFVGGVRRAMC